MNPASGGDQLTGRVHLPGSGGKSAVLSLPAFTHGFLPSRKQTAFPGRLSSRKGGRPERKIWSSHLSRLQSEPCLKNSKKEGKKEKKRKEGRLIGAGGAT